jgi:hypothetical protein
MEERQPSYLLVDYLGCREKIKRVHQAVLFEMKLDVMG